MEDVFKVLPANFAIGGHVQLGCTGFLVLQEYTEVFKPIHCRQLMFY
jgi:hypothetical protein